MNQTDLHAVHTAEPFTSGALRLDDWGVIVAQGPDAASFLHTQLTQSMQTLPNDRARLGGLLLAQGPSVGQLCGLPPGAGTPGPSVQCRPACHHAETFVDVCHAREVQADRRQRAMGCVGFDWRSRRHLARGRCGKRISLGLWSLGWRWGCAVGAPA